jgi:hypothetical protein
VICVKADKTNRQVLDRAARAGLVMQRVPSDDNAMIYKRHILMLGVILGRDLFVSLLSIIQDQSSMLNRVGTRRGWIDWEHLVIGGHIVGCGSPAFQGLPPSLDRLVIQRKGEMGSMEMASYFILSDEVVSAVVDRKVVLSELGGSLTLQRRPIGNLYFLSDPPMGGQKGIQPIRIISC